MVDNSLTNESLLEAYKRLDPKGFDLFYKRNHQIVFNFILSKLGNRAEAEEVFQETFFKIHKAILSYDSSQSALGWVFTIARNTTIDFVRKRQLPTESNADHVPVKNRTEEALEAREILSQAMKGLTSQEVELLRMRFFNEDSYEEIAKHLDIREDGARQKISRLLRKIRGAVD